MSGLLHVVASASILIIVASLAIASTALANPVPVEEGPEVVFAVFGLLFLMNLPVNVLWYCVGVLGLSKARMLTFTRVPGFSGKSLSKKVLGAAVLITLFGALIDLYSGDENIFWFKEIGEPVIVALVLVFVSVTFVSMIIPRFRIAPSLLMAGGMAVMNLVHWTVIATVFYGDASSENPAPTVVVYGAVCAILSVFAVRMISRIAQNASQSHVESGKTG